MLKERNTIVVNNLHKGMTSEKSNKYKELKSDPNSREYQEWFLKYTPGEKTNKQYTKKQLPPPTKGNKILKLLGL